MKIREDKGQKNGRWLCLAERLLSSVFFCLLLSSFFFLVSCSDETEIETEFDNWEVRNDAALDQWAANSSFRKIKTYTKDTNSTGKNSDYIYVEVLESGSGTESPLYTDSVRVAYRGRLIPTKSYTEGYVFDQTFVGDFNWATAGVADFVTNAMIDGFTTALMNMHIGDYWRVYIPYQLGYGTTSTNAVQGYSNLVFEIAMYDTWHPDENRPHFKARQN